MATRSPGSGSRPGSLAASSGPGAAARCPASRSRRREASSPCRDPLAALEGIPFRVDGAADVGHQPLGVPTRPRQGVARGGARGLRVRLGAPDAGRALPFAVFQLSDTLRFLSIARVQSGDELLERGLLGGAMRPRALDQARRQAEPRPDGEGIALPGPVVHHPERRLEPVAVELYRGVAGPRMGGGEALERLEVGGGRAEGAARGQLLQHGLGQRGAVVGVGARAQLVQKHEGLRVHVLDHLTKLLDEG